MSQAHFNEDMIRYYKKEINQLSNETGFQREKVSTCIKSLIEYTDSHKKEDFLWTGTPQPGSENPYQEKKRCNLL